MSGERKRKGLGGKLPKQRKRRRRLQGGHAGRAVTVAGLLLVLWIAWTVLFYWGHAIPVLRDLPRVLPLWAKAAVYVCFIASSICVAAQERLTGPISPWQILAYVGSAVSSVLFTASFLTGSPIRDSRTFLPLAAGWVAVLWFAKRYHHEP